MRHLSLPYVLYWIIRHINQIPAVHMLKYSDHVCDPSSTPDTVGITQTVHKKALQLEFLYSSLPVGGQGIRRTDIFRASFPHQVTCRWLVVSPVGAAAGFAD